MTKRFDVRFPLSDGTQERRTAYIYLPDSYSYCPQKRYPVLYMFDGHNVFFDSDATYGKSWGMEKYMEESKTPMIIAAVECNHSPNNGRIEEYSPFSFQDPRLGPITGRGKATMEWFVNIFKREIDLHYRTLPDRKHTFIAGSSMGGLMSIYALMQYNHIFSRAAALSPSLWISPAELNGLLREAQFTPDTILYMDYGSEEFHDHEGLPGNFGETAALFMERGLALHCRIVPGGTHCEASWERQIPFFMKSLLYDLKKDSVQKITMQHPLSFD